MKADYTAVQQQIDDLDSDADILSDVSFGDSGVVFAVRRNGYTISYHPDEDVIGMDALASGMTMECFSDGYQGTLRLNGIRYYATCRYYNGKYLFCAIPLREMRQSAAATVIIVLVVFIIAAAMLVADAVLTREEILQEERRHVLEGETQQIDRHYKKLTRKMLLNRTLLKRLLPVCVVAVLVILAVTVYAQVLLVMSNQSINNNQHITDLKAAIDDTNKNLASLQEEYNQQYVEKARTAAYILQHYDKPLTMEMMQELADALQVNNIYYFGKNYRVTAASTELWDFTLSEDPDSQSYPFRAVLEGTTSVLVQDPMKNDADGSLVQYTAVAMSNENHHVTGMVQLEVSPEALSVMTQQADIAYVLAKSAPGNNGFAFGISKTDNTFIYWPDADLIGTSAISAGVQEYQLAADVTDTLAIDGKRYYCASGEMGDYWLYAGVPAESCFSNCLPVAGATAGASLILMLILIFLVSLQPKAALEEMLSPEGDNRDGTVEVREENGKFVRIINVGNRWHTQAVEWQALATGEKLKRIVKGLVFLFATILTVMAVGAEVFTEENSLLKYIMSGNWKAGVNFFAITACLFMVVMLCTIYNLIHIILMWLARSMGARGETTCRILDNFLKFGLVIYAIFKSLSLMGTQTSTLLTSAGILSLALSLGSQSLIGDILAGLFIVFEGEFQVGDIITIGDFRGVVMEIGVRTVKVRDEDTQNVRIFSNRNVGDVVNMTQGLSMVTATLSIDYSADLEQVEEVLRKELPKIAEQHPEIRQGPTYCGVSRMGDSSVDLLIRCFCHESDRFAVNRTLNRELFLMAGRNNISIPFNQMVITPREGAPVVINIKEAAQAGENKPEEEK